MKYAGCDTAMPTGTCRPMVVVGASPLEKYQVINDMAFGYCKWPTGSVLLALAAEE